MAIIHFLFKTYNVLTLYLYKCFIHLSILNLNHMVTNFLNFEFFTESVLQLRIQENSFAYKMLARILIKEGETGKAVRMLNRLIAHEGKSVVIKNKVAIFFSNERNTERL